jgi:hypothetical protein
LNFSEKNLVHQLFHLLGIDTDLGIRIGMPWMPIRIRKKSLVYQLFHLLGIDTDPGIRIRPDPDPQHWVSDQINGIPPHLGAGAGEAVPHAEQPLHQFCHRLHGVAYAVLTNKQNISINLWCQPALHMNESKWIWNLWFFLSL